MCVCVSSAHLGQSGLFMCDLVFADGRQLLQRVAVVGQRPRQPCKLGPSCRSEDIKHISDQIQYNTVRQRSVIQFMTPGTHWSYRIFPQLLLLRISSSCRVSAPTSVWSEFLLQGINTTRISDNLMYIFPANVKTLGCDSD